MKTLHRFASLCVILALLLTAACAKGPAEEVKEVKPIKIGALFPLTGASTHEGIDERRGVELAVDEINAAGGIGGRPLEVIFEDSESRPDAGVDAAHKLIDVDKVPVIIGVFSSGVTLPVSEYAQEQGVVVINPASTSPKIRDVGDYLFSTIGLDHLMGSEQAKFALEEGCTKASVLVPNNPYGIGMEEWMVKTFKEGGGEILDIVEYPLEQTDYRAEVQRLFAHDPPCILYTAYGEESRIITKQAYEMGLGRDAKWFGGYLTLCTGTAEPETVDPLPFRGMSGYPYPEGERYPEGKAFERYRAEFNIRRR